MFYLTGDIDCSSLTGLSRLIDVMQDKLDGRGFTLLNLTLTTSTEGAGLVGSLQGNGAIENLNIEGLTITDTKGYPIGSIASVISPSATVDNCTVTRMTISVKVMPEPWPER